MVVKRMHALAVGRVQGVFFRDYTRQEAQRLGLTGWVRNLSNGSVETEFEGSGDHVDIMLEWLATGSPLSLVSGVKAKEIPVMDGEDTFEILF